MQKWNKRTFWAALICFVTTQIGCNSTFNSWLDPSQVGGFTRETTLDIRTSLSIQDTPTGIPGATDPSPEDLIPIYEEYRFGPGDSLSIRIFELLASNTETSTQANIDDIGTIILPVLGQVRVAGMSRSEITEELKAQLIQRQVIVTDPVVIVEPLVRRGLTFVLFGATPGPNVYPVPRPNTSLLEALNIAGGFPETATEVYIIRNTEGAAAKSAADEMQTARKKSRKQSRKRRFASARRKRSMFTLSDGVTGSAGGGPPSQDERDELIDAAAGGRAAPAVNTSLEQEAPGDASTQSRWVFTAEGEWIETDAAPKQMGTGQMGIGQAGTDPGFNTISEDADSTSGAPLEEGAEPAIDWERLAGEDAVGRVIRIDAEALRNGDPRQNVIVRGGDNIRILAGDVGEYYMMGQVGRPGAYSLTGRRITLKTAIASAGNLAPLAWPNRCTVYRRYGDREEMHQVNLDAIFAGKEQDLLLKNNDLILVGTHPAASFLAVIRNAFRLTYGFGFVYDRNFADIDSYGGQLNPSIAQARGIGSRFPNLFR